VDGAFRSRPATTDHSDGFDRAVDASHAIDVGEYRREGRNEGEALVAGPAAQSLPGQLDQG
jgi:hypothetical protein